MFVIRFFGLLLKLSTAQVQFLASTTTLSISIISKHCHPSCRTPKGWRETKEYKKSGTASQKAFPLLFDTSLCQHFPFFKSDLSSP